MRANQERFPLSDAVAVAAFGRRVAFNWHLALFLLLFLKTVKKALRGRSGARRADE